MKSLTLLIICSLFTFSAQAAYPVSFTCKGVSNNNEEIKFSLKGLISADPAKKIEAGDLTLNLIGKTNKGTVKINNQKVRALKTKFSTLVMYSIETKVKTTGYDLAVIAVTNKSDGSSTLSFFDKLSADLDSIEYKISCAEEVK